MFASTLNSKYFIGACVTLNTLKRYAGDTIQYNVFVFDGLSTEQMDILKRIYANIVFRHIDQNAYVEYKLDNPFRSWDYNVYNRFEIFTLKANKIIFLDFDLLFLDNINYLLNTQIDFGASAPRFKDEFTDYIHENSFDAGVMIIGEKFITTDVKYELLKLTKMRNWSSDEPVLNYFFNKHLTVMPRRYNVLTPEFRLNRNDAAVLQYVGINKPWLGSLIHQNFDEFVIRNNTLLDMILMNRNYIDELSDVSRNFLATYPK